jgi:hypothetical protein
VSASEFLKRIVPLINSAVAVFPKELSQMEYARPSGRVRTIAGSARQASQDPVKDGDALRDATFVYPTGLALDLWDEAAGPQLFIAEYYARIRCMNMCTNTVTTIFGHANSVHGAGTPSVQSLFGLTVAPNGVLYAADRTAGRVRRIGGVRAVARAAGMATATATTLMGAADADSPFARSAIPLFRTALHNPYSVLWASGAATGPSVMAFANSESDVGRLYVGCGRGVVHEFGLSEGKRWQYITKTDADAATEEVTGLAVTDDGARLFAVNKSAVHLIDLLTGNVTCLVKGKGTLTAGPVTDGPDRGHLNEAGGAVIDPVTRSLLMVDFRDHRLVRLRGIEL